MRKTTHTGNISKNKHGQTSAKFTYFNNHVRVLTKIFRQFQAENNIQSKQYHNIQPYNPQQLTQPIPQQLKCNSCNHTYTEQTGSRFTDDLLNTHTTE